MSAVEGTHLNLTGAHRERGSEEAGKRTALQFDFGWRTSGKLRLCLATRRVTSTYAVIASVTKLPTSPHLIPGPKTQRERVKRQRKTAAGERNRFPVRSALQVQTLQNAARAGSSF